MVTRRLADLKQDTKDFKARMISAEREKLLSIKPPASHPLFGPEIRALRQLKRDYPETDYVFMTERKAPITADTFRKIIARAGEKAELGLATHPHMLRHPTGFKLANDGRDTRSISTVSV